MEGEKSKLTCVVMFKGSDNNYYYICKESPYELKKARTSKEYVKTNAELYEDSIYLDNKKLKDDELHKKCLKTMEKALKEKKCTRKQYERCNKNQINSMIMDIRKKNKSILDALFGDNLNAADDKELKTAIMKNREDYVLKIKTNDRGSVLVKEKVSLDKINEEDRKRLCNKKGNVLFNQEKFTEEEARKAIKNVKNMEYAEDNQKKQESRANTKTEDNKTAGHITDEDIKELELYRKKERAIVDFEKKLFEVRDNLHAMMNVALGKRKANNYLDIHQDRENNLRGFCNVRARDKKLFNQRAWYKSGRSLIKDLNEKFDKMISFAKDVVWMNVLGKREHAHNFLEDRKKQFNEIYSFLKQRQYSIDGEIIEYKWKDLGNNTSSKNLKSPDNKIKSI